MRRPALGAALLVALAVPFAAGAQVPTTSTLPTASPVPGPTVQRTVTVPRVATPVVSTAPTRTISETPIILTEVEHDIPLRRAPGRGTPYAVSDFFSRDVGDGCRYSIALSGVVVIDPGQSDGSGADPARYAPRLDAGASLACDGRPTVRTTRHRLSARGLTRERLVDALTALTRIRSASSGHACEYAPRFGVVAHELRAPAVRYTCETARGGGPANETRVVW